MKARVKHPKPNIRAATNWCYHYSKNKWRRDYDEFIFTSEIDYAYFLNFLDQYNLKEE